MLIINADDYGRDGQATDNILICHQKKRITSTSAMVFMADSERASNLARMNSLGIGLHLNFTSPFSGPAVPDGLRKSHERIMAFLRGRKYHFLLFNPFLKRPFEYSYRAQNEEFCRLYDREPTHIDGHHHMHLCANMIVQRLIPLQTRVRTTFSFGRKEKDFINRRYRRWISKWVSKRYICTDLLYSLAPFVRPEGPGAGGLSRIIRRAEEASVELLVHAQNQGEFDFLMSDECAALLAKAEKIGYGDLPGGRIKGRRI
jgi:chitin disaccharide deacetylase